jgi:hypothetical protein
MNLFRPAIRATLIVALAIACFSICGALPRFASRTGATCGSCHVNPSGAMLRQAFGAQYGRESLPVQDWSKGFELEDFGNLIPNVLGIGADMRTLYFSRQVPDSGGRTSNVNGFFQMQGDLDLYLRVAKKVGFFLSKGLYSGFEAFALLNVLPAHGYVKVGKFLPNYGMRTDDHTAFVRTYTGFSPEQGRPELTGLETAISPGPITIAGGVYNSSDGFGASEGNSKAVLGRAEGMFSLTDDLHLALGGNVFTKGNSLGGRTVLYGGFGSVSLGQLTVLGEADFMRSSGGARTVTGFTSYVEADWPIIQGFDLKLAYDFYDPDIDYKTGAYARYTAGMEFFPLPGVELRPLYRINRDQLKGENYSEADVLLHLYF